MVDILKCNIPIFIYLRYLFIDPCNTSHNYFYFYFNVKFGFSCSCTQSKMDWIHLKCLSEAQISFLSNEKLTTKALRFVFPILFNIL